MRGRAFVLALAAPGLAVALGACGGGGSPKAQDAGEPGVTSYLCTENGGAMLLQWNTQGGSLTGTVQLAVLTGTAPNESVTHTSGDVLGTKAGKGITLNIGSATDYGNFGSGGSLVINLVRQDGAIVQLACKTGDTSAWNSALSNLKAQSSNDNEKANQQAEQQQAAQAKAQQQQQAQQAAQAQQAQNATDAQTLATDTKTLASYAAQIDSGTTLASDINTMNQDLATEQSDWQTAEGTVCNVNVGQVENDFGQLQNADYNVPSDVNTLQSDEQTLNADISQVRADETTVKDDGGSVPAASTAALTAGQKALTDTNNAISWANGQAQSIMTQGQQIDNAASAYNQPSTCS